jgi:ComF family protein
MKGGTELFLAITRFLDACFPRRCVGCGQKVVSQSALSPFVCRRCEPEKLDPVKFGDGYFGYRYTGIFQTLIHDLKFNHRRDVIPVLRAHVSTGLLDKYDLIIPVPSHWMRRFEHGGDHIQSIFQVRSDIVKRSRYTPAFHKLGKEQRAKAIKGAFQVKHPGRIAAAKILIVDDIYTTGATFRELRRVLLDYGAESVEGYFLTRA